METVLKAIADWIKGILTAGIMSNLSGLFDDVNTQVGNIAQQVGTKPSAFEPRVFAMIEALSRNVVLPIAGIILTFIACYELIEMITQHNNMAQFEPALIMRWIFKTAVSVWFISNTFDIVMAVFDITQKVVSDSSGIIAGNTRVNDIGLSMLQSSLMQMDVGPLFGLFLQSFFIGITMRILSIIIFVIVYGRMIEIYCIADIKIPISPVIQDAGSQLILIRCKMFQQIPVQGVPHSLALYVCLVSVPERAELCNHQILQTGCVELHLCATKGQRLQPVLEVVRKIVDIGFHIGVDVVLTEQAVQFFRNAQGINIMGSAGQLAQ